MRRTVTALFFAIMLSCAAQKDGKTQNMDAIQHIEIKGNQQWYVGITSQGELMPLTNTYEVDMEANVHGNQVQPLLLSDSGDVIWSEYPMQISFSKGVLKITGKADAVVQKKAGKTLKEGYSYANDNYFPPSGILPDEMLFSAPQYNTWIELTYNQNQKDILKYAHGIIDNGFPPGVLMIDDNWQEDYGKWQWHPGRFPDPKAMMNELHDMGFKVMVWVCPFVSPDSDVYRELVSQQAFLITETKESTETTMPQKDFRGNPKPQMVTWWNGISAVLDLSNPIAEKWFKTQLNALQNEYGVDGFKFDAGDAEFYRPGIGHGEVSANDQAMLFGKIGLDYPLNEYRAMWKMGGQPLVERLRDKLHTWEDLEKLVPQMALSGLMGYTFNCPDMIGGGDFTSFLDGAELDQELIVRSAQCHALMPMMQFSVAPWRVLNEEHLLAVKSAVALRKKYTDIILETARTSAKTGEPILRNMAYEFPDGDYALVKDQFLIGSTILVAPVVEKGQTQREIQIPEGTWKSESGKSVKGPKTITVTVGLNDIPLYVKQQ